MKIKKRDGTIVDFNREKIVLAMEKAFRSVGKAPTSEELDRLSKIIVATIEEKFPKSHLVTVEEIQDQVELTLIDNKYYDVIKSFILYRAKHTTDRKVLEDFEEYIKVPEVLEIIKEIRDQYDSSRYPIEGLFLKFQSFVKPNQSEKDLVDLLTKASSELTSKESPNWEYVASRFMIYNLNRAIEEVLIKHDIQDFKGKIHFLTKKGLYGDYIEAGYTDEEIDQLEAYLEPERNKLFTFSALDLVIKRYLIKTHDNKIVETPQEMFMGIAMHLALKEKDKLYWAKRIYDCLSKLQITVATPTMSNARKPFNQLSSCFIDTVPDTLEGIYRSINNFAQVSKHGGGMGLYFGKVRANGSDIRGFKGVAGGVIRWIKLANDTAVAVDQLGVRQGSVAVYLDVWHKDILEFLQLKTNNGDDRMKAHDVFPAVCYPDYFWEMVRDDLDGTWYMMDPHEILIKKGYALEDSFGDDWKEKYLDCVKDESISKRTIKLKDLVRLIIKSWTETGTPFTFNRDTVNKMNPNNHKGLIYSSNLCTEILQNMSQISTISETLEVENGDEILVTKTKPGDFVVCNLASLVLGNINLEDKEELEEIVETAIRGLDNVIDLNFYPLEYARHTNHKYRPIGLGTSGYHQALVQRGIMYSDLEDHLAFADKIYEEINYYAIKASGKIAEEKGSYEYFKGSDWENGAYFEKRNYTDDKWTSLKEKIKTSGLRNGYIMAVAPTGSTSIIAGTTAAVDPVMSRYFLEEKKGSIVPRVAPGLTPQTFWLYENAHEIDQNHTIDATVIRQRHIDQGQSVNLYITTEMTMRTILNLYIRAWEKGVKTIYYVRSKSLEVAECDSCSS